MEVAEDCADADIPLFLETLGFSIDEASAKLTDEARRDVVVRTARRLTALGGDVLKCEFPYDATVTDRSRWTEACAELDEASAIPWVILSAGVDDATFEAQTEVACAPAHRACWWAARCGRRARPWHGAERDAWLADRGRRRACSGWSISSRPRHDPGASGLPCVDQPEPGRGLVPGLPRAGVGD